MGYHAHLWKFSTEDLNRAAGRDVTDHYNLVVDLLQHIALRQQRPQGAK
jgi:hypothetical protein